MKKSLTPLLALAASMVLALTVRAQPEPKILVVDIAKVFDHYYEKDVEEAKIRSDAQKADADMQDIIKAGNELVDQYKNLVDQSNNPALTPEAQAKAKDDAKKKLDEINTKKTDLDNFKQTVQRQLQERAQNIRSVLIDSISKTAADIAKRHGATLLLDKSGVSIFGAAVVLYSDPAYEITDEVIKEVNKDHPPSPTGSSGATPGSSSVDEPKLTVPPIAPANP